MSNVALANWAFGIYIAAAVLYTGQLLSKKRAIGIAGLVVLLAGLALHSASIIMRWVEAGRAPFASQYESMVLFSWAGIVAYLWIEFRYKLWSIAPVVIVLSILGLSYASLYDSTITPLMPALKSNWLTIHVFVYFIGYAALGVSAVAAALHIFTSMRHAAVAKGTAQAVFGDVSFKCVAVGFPLLTVGLITGAVWANVAWGTYWGWDPKETWALISWLIYAFYLHVRFVHGWRGLRLSWVSVLGFAAVIFTYLGMNYLPVAEQSLHLYK